MNGDTRIMVVCKRGAGDNPMEEFSHVLITTQAEAIYKGFALINEKWMIRYVYKTSPFPYPVDGWRLAPHEHIEAIFPEIGILARIVFITESEFDLGPAGAYVTLTFEYYEPSEETLQ